MTSRPPFTAVLIAASDVAGTVDADTAAAAIAAGLEAAGWPAEILPVASRDDLDAAGFDGRMRAARSVVVATAALTAADLRGGLAGEIATRARQAGVPCHAIVARNELDPFGARILDLQAVLEAATPPALEAAGRRLGGWLRPEPDGA